MRLLTLFLSAISFLCFGDDIEVNLEISVKKVNFTGTEIKAMAINNSIPAPTLTFTEGDVATINVKNNTLDDASIHWHGLILPQPEDGVPYVTFFPIKPLGEHTYRFELTHPGTYWYHSHSRIDEQKGQYGAIVVHPKSGYEDIFDYDEVIQLSDWTDEDPLDVLSNLKKDGDWYALKKDSVISIAGYYQKSNISTWVKNRWNRMEGMDVSDVGLDAFLANGKKNLHILPNAKPGEIVRLRIINSAASTIFKLEQFDGNFKIISADGTDVKPITANEIQISMAETYDVLITVPESGTYKFSANSIDGTGGSTITIGKDSDSITPQPQKPNLYMDMSTHLIHSRHEQEKRDGSSKDPSHQHHTQNTSMHSHMHHENKNSNAIKTLRYSDLQSRKPVIHEGELQLFTLELTGNMDTYNWSFNNTPLSKADTIKIDRGKVVRFKFVNKTMMNHPLHLHGHFFKVISNNGEYDVIKHTVNVAPFETVVIEFAANYEKDWLFHCHNLYHAKTGMSRIVRYSDYDGNPEFKKAMKKSNDIKDNDWYHRTDISTYSTYDEFNLRLSNSSHTINLEINKAQTESFEKHLQYSYRIGRWSEYFLAVRNEESDTEVMAGFSYITPFLINSQVWVNQDAQIHISLNSEFQLTKRVAIELEGNTHKEWTLRGEYRLSPNLALGVIRTESSALGLGLEATF